MTGCPNGCARPYLAEIGLVGKGPGRYNLYLGAAFDGSRLSKLYAEDLQHDGDHRGARSVVRRLREGARAGRALRRIRHPRGLRGADRQRRGLPREHGSEARRMNALVPAPAVRTTCPYCGVGCGVLRDAGRAGGAAIAGDPEHPANFGRLCSKGAALGETLGLGTRLLHPMLRQHDGTLARTDWDTALEQGRRRTSSASSSATDRTRSRSISRASCSPRTITSPTS